MEAIPASTTNEIHDNEMDWEWDKILDTDLIFRTMGAFSCFPVSHTDHSVASAIRYGSELTYISCFFGVHISGPIDEHCSELAALSAFRKTGLTGNNFTAFIVVVQTPGKTRGEETMEIVSPCGKCRRALFDYNPDIRIFLIDEDGEMKSRKVWLD